MLRYFSIEPLHNCLVQIWSQPGQLTRSASAPLFILQYPTVSLCFSFFAASIPSLPLSLSHFFISLFVSLFLALVASFLFQLLSFFPPSSNFSRISHCFYLFFFLCCVISGSPSFLLPICISFFICFVVSGARRFFILSTAIFLSNFLQFIFRIHFCKGRFRWLNNRTNNAENLENLCVRG